MKKILLLLSCCLFNPLVFADQCPSGSDVTVTSLFPLNVIAPAGWMVKKVETISSDFGYLTPADVSVKINRVETGYVKNLDRSSNIPFGSCGYRLEVNPNGNILYERGYTSNPFHNPVYYNLIQLVPITMPHLSVGFFSDHLGGLDNWSSGEHIYDGWELNTTHSYTFSKEYFYTCYPGSTGYMTCNWLTDSATS